MSSASGSASTSAKTPSATESCGCRHLAGAMRKHSGSGRLQWSVPESAMSVTTSAPDRLAPVEPERGFTPPLERLPVLLQRADAAAGDARRAATAELNAGLGQM